MSSTLTALQPPAAARTAGAPRGVGSGRSHGQLQGQIHRLHRHGSLGAAAQGRPSGGKQPSQEKVVDRSSSALTQRFTLNGRPEGGGAASRVTQRTAFAPGARPHRWKRQIGLQQTNKQITTKISRFQFAGLSYLQVVSLKH